jgi:hypothetical protein
MAKTAALVFGVIFVLVGILGWIPNPIVGAGALFDTNHIHDLVHLAIGIVLIVVALMYESSAALAMKVFGIIYLLVAVLGFILVPSGGLILGLVETNMADHLLHVVLGVILVALGFMLKGGSGMPMSATGGTSPMGGVRM